jgi:hypothetical protein
LELDLRPRQISIAGVTDPLQEIGRTLLVQIALSGIMDLLNRAGIPDERIIGISAKGAL